MLERRLHFHRKFNPFFAHADAAFWIIQRNGRTVGRISAQIDHLHLQRYGDATGHVGFIEAVDDPQVFSRLLGTAEDWLRSKGMSRALGPVSFAMWDQPGLLVEGFDQPPSVLMGHARPYYAEHFIRNDYRPVQDLLAYDYTSDINVLAKVKRILAWADRDGSIALRHMRMGLKHFRAEVALMLDILNDGWSANWGFVPWTEAEGDDMALKLRLIIKSRDVVFAEHKGQPSAFAMILPNLNEAARDLNGRLFPFGWAKLLWRLKVRGTRTKRLAIVGVRKSLQNSPEGAALAFSVIRAAWEHCVVECRATKGEASWVLDSNERMKQMIERTGARLYKRYRIYEKPL
jgi:hypothetical protein